MLILSHRGVNYSLIRYFVWNISDSFLSVLLLFSILYWRKKKIKGRNREIDKNLAKFLGNFAKEVLNLQPLDLAGIELLQPFLCGGCQLLRLVGLFGQVFVGGG